VILDSLRAVLSSLPFWVAVAGTALLTPVAGRVGRRIGAVDSPGQGKIHTRPIPRSGGLALAGGLLVAVLGGMAAGSGAISWSREMIGVLTGAGIVTCVGLWDDTKGTTPLVKAIGQLAAAGCLVLVGIRPDFLPAPLAVIIVPVYVLGSSNAMNLIDGLDGLATGVAAIAALGFVAVGMAAGVPIVSGLALVLLGSCLGFLLHNFHPARIFLGDSGSNLIGFLLAVLMIGVVTDRHDPRWFVAPLVILGLPIVDTAWSIVRRRRQRQSILAGDLGHIYNRMVERGLGHRGAVLACYAIGVACVACGLLIVGSIGRGPS